MFPRRLDKVPDSEPVRKRQVKDVSKRTAGRELIALLRLPRRHFPCATTILWECVSRPVKHPDAGRGDKVTRIIKGAEGLLKRARALPARQDLMSVSVCVY